MRKIDSYKLIIIVLNIIFELYTEEFLLSFVSLYTLLSSTIIVPLQVRENWYMYYTVNKCLK